jgi:dolichol-phosphate mannosyltransferase
MLTVMLPVLNEEDALPRLFEKLASNLSGIPYRVVVVDDGSTDSSVEVVRDWQDRIPLELVQHKTNKGLGEAMKTGFSYCLSDSDSEGAIVTMDADDTHNPKYIKGMYEKFLEGYEFIILSRYQEGSREKGVSLKRILLSRVANLLYRVCFPYNGIRDYTCGYRLYGTRLLRSYMNKYRERSFESRGFVIMSEVLVKLQALKPRALELPFELEYDLKYGYSKIRISSSVMEHLFFIFSNLLRKKN